MLRYHIFNAAVHHVGNAYQEGVISVYTSTKKLLVGQMEQEDIINSPALNNGCTVGLPCCIFAVGVRVSEAIRLPNADFD